MLDRRIKKAYPVIVKATVLKRFSAVFALQQHTAGTPEAVLLPAYAETMGSVFLTGPFFVKTVRGMVAYAAHN